MTRISKITTQKKRKDRYNIFLDKGAGEEYGFSVDEAVLIEFGLRKNMELDDSLISALIQKDTLHKSYTLAINFLSYRMRTKKEIYDYLVKKEVEPEHIPKIMDKLGQEGLIDDKQFAEAFVRTRILTTSKGPLLVKKELIEKGVSKPVADEAITQYDFGTQYEKALKWVNKKLNSSKSNSFQTQLQKVQTTLLQKGFTQDVIKEVISESKSKKDDDMEWEALSVQGQKLLRKHARKYEGMELKQKMKEGLYRKGFGIDLINRFLEEELEE